MVAKDVYFLRRAEGRKYTLLNTLCGREGIGLPHHWAKQEVLLNDYLLGRFHIFFQGKKKKLQTPQDTFNDKSKEKACHELVDGLCSTEEITD